MEVRVRDTSSGYMAQSLRPFRRVLKKWIVLNEKYCRASHGNDIPWGYIERASISIFAGACWSAGYIALEEYSELKGGRDSHIGKAKYGRCDLYVALGSQTYIVEAKMIRPSLASSGWREAVLGWLDIARQDVNKTYAHNQERKLGMLFVVPTIPRKNVGKSEELIGEFVKFLRGHDEICSAWVFPKNVRTFSWSSERERMYPGTAVLMKALRN